VRRVGSPGRQAIGRRYGGAGGRCRSCGRPAGREPESSLLHASHYAVATPAIAVTYANACRRAAVTDNLGGFSFGASDAAGAPAPLAAAAAAQLFGNANGIAPAARVNLINDAAVGGPRIDAASVSPSTGIADFNVGGALCLRALATGVDPALADARRLRNGVRQVLIDADLRGKPAILVQGRADTLVPVNHASRAWYAAAAEPGGAHDAARRVVARAGAAGAERPADRRGAGGGRSHRLRGPDAARPRLTAAARGRERQIRVMMTESTRRGR
jgi:hypothetical protein